MATRLLIGGRDLVAEDSMILSKCSERCSVAEAYLMIYLAAAGAIPARQIEAKTCGMIWRSRSKRRLEAVKRKSPSPNRSAAPSALARAPNRDHALRPVPRAVDADRP